MTTNSSSVSSTLRLEEKGEVAFATLTRPEALNTLNLELVRSLRAALSRWERASEIRAVVVRGEGSKAFCAGGDVKSIVLELRRGNASYAADFFIDEYRLDYAIHNYSKPIIVAGHGFTMGGGLGLMAGASVRLATNSTVLAMPEITIGLFPDVGASYFLQDAPGSFGLFAALTGARLNSSDAIFAGLVDWCLPEEALNEYYFKLSELVLSGDAQEDKKNLRAFTESFAHANAGKAPAAHWPSLLTDINGALSPADPRGALAALGRLAQHPDQKLAHAANTFLQGSPTSALVICEQFRRARPLSLAACLRMELDLASQFSRRPDFCEGVRALLLDKDHAPRWKPASLDQVSDAEVLAHFNSPWQADNHPLRDLEDSVLNS